MCDKIFPRYRLVKTISIVVIALIIFIVILAIMKNPMTRLHSGLFEEEEIHIPELENKKEDNDNDGQSKDADEGKNE